MKKGIIGKKLGMTQIFMEDGSVIPVTVIEAGPCPVTQKKTTETDGYEAVQLAFEDIREKLVNKPAAGPVSYTHLDVYKRQPLISAEDFYVPEHTEIFRAMQSMYLKSKNIDVVTLIDELVKSGTYDESGGREYPVSYTHLDVYKRQV